MQGRGNQHRIEAESRAFVEVAAASHAPAAHNAQLWKLGPQLPAQRRRHQAAGNSDLAQVKDNDPLDAAGHGLPRN